MFSRSSHSPIVVAASNWRRTVAPGLEFGALRAKFAREAYDAQIQNRSTFGQYSTAAGAVSYGIDYAQWWDNPRDAAVGQSAEESLAMIWFGLSGIRRSRLYEEGL